jgi:RHS repeat-associated protein
MHSHIDNLTNRYDSVGGNSLAYDAAGNLTTDKDGYQYEYDYENRIAKITKDSNDIAEFAYDALGRRIKKRDSIADTNNIYYCNDNWQILCDYNDAGTPQAWFAYGNYIDEVVLMSKSFTSWRYYIHDHLYSPVALMGASGSSPIERYEYDAYGNCQIMDAYYNPRSSSSYGNPYYFTGRQLDFLDAGSLKIQYNRNRYYDYYTGRWLTHDPEEYIDGLNLYEYVEGNPLSNLDPEGTFSITPLPIILPPILLPGPPPAMPASTCGDCVVASREERVWPYHSGNPEPAGWIETGLTKLSFNVEVSVGSCGWAPACKAVVTPTCDCQIRTWYYVPGPGRRARSGRIRAGGLRLIGGKTPKQHEEMHISKISNIWKGEIQRSIDSIRSKSWCVCKNKAECYASALRLWISAYKEYCDFVNFAFDAEVYMPDEAKIRPRTASLNALHKYHDLKKEATEKEVECDNMDSLAF